MNEELKIVIKAVTDSAKKSISDVKKELDGLKSSGSKSGKSIDVSMKTIAKGAAAAVAAIAAVTAALVKMGKASLDYSREQARLISGFQAAGSTAQQAGETYRQIYRYLGETDTAAEAANHLAMITTNTQDLAEWTKITQGIYARWGDSLKVESFTEAANESIRVGKAVGVMADALNWAGVSEDDYNATMARTTSLQEREVITRQILNSLYSDSANIYEANNQALLRYYESQVAVDQAMAQAGQAILPLMTSLNELAAVLLTALKPAFEAVASVINVFVNMIIIAVSWVTAFFSLFTGSGSKAKETTSQISKNVSAAGGGLKNATGGAGGLGKALGGAAKAAKELKKQTMKFDELNILRSNESASSGGGGGGGRGSSGGGVGGLDMSGFDFDTSILDDVNAKTEEFKQKMESVKEQAEAVLTILGAIAGGLVLSEIIGFLQYFISCGATFAERLKNCKYYIEDVFGAKAAKKVKKFAGALMIAAGAILAVKGYTDAWVNGIDWGNFFEMLSGVALIVGGIAMTLGRWAAGSAAVAGGIALIVIGVKDFIENGYSMQNVLTILAGVLTIVVGVFHLFHATILANPVFWIIAGIAALVAAFVILWNECEGFRNFWINLWEKCKTLFNSFVTWIKPIAQSVGEFFVKAWNAIWNALKPIIDSVVNAFKEGWKLIKVVWDLVKPYFEKLWEGIKITFSVVGAVLSAYFKIAWELIKAIWEVVAPYFAVIWETIKIIYSVVATWFSGMFKTAWESIKLVWDVVTGYFKAIWDTIAGIFSVVRNVLQGDFQGAWDAIKGIIDSWGSYFGKIWESIKKVFSSTKQWFSETFSAAWEAVKKVFSTWGSFFSGLWNTIKTTFSTLGSSLAEAIGSAVKTGLNSVIRMIEDKINSAIDLINGAINLINKIPGVNISRVGKLSLPRLAKGGIVTSSTIANIGEAGKEAVLPLERNTEWMDKLADKISVRNGSPTKIVLSLDGRELGWATVKSINDITRQRGSIPLTIG